MKPIWPDQKAFRMMADRLTRRAIENPGAVGDPETDAQPTPSKYGAQTSYAYTSLNHASDELRKRLANGTTPSPRRTRRGRSQS